MPKNDTTRLRHILDAAREAIEFCRGRHREDLGTDRQLALSLVHLLEIIGEAARAVSSDVRASHPEVAWPKMVGMRDRLIHGYFDINYDVVWSTVQEDLPTLAAQIERLLALQH